MVGEKVLEIKGPILLKIARILLILGWITFFFWNFYLWIYTANEYKEDMSNFVFFENEKDREEYRASMLIVEPAWISRASLVDQCRPMIWVKDFYLQKVRPFIYFSGALILLTLIFRIPFDELKEKGKKIEGFFKKFQDEDD